MTMNTGPVPGAKRHVAELNLMAFERELAEHGAGVTNRFPFPLRDNSFNGRWNYLLGNMHARRHIQVALPGVALDDIRKEGGPAVIVDGEPYTWDEAARVVANSLSAAEELS